MSRVPGDSPAADAPPEFDSRPDTADASGHLRDRLERLPPGHPSSPYEADGTRRESAPRSHDLDTGADDDAFAGNSDVAGKVVPEWRPDAGRETDEAASSDEQPEVAYRFTEAEWIDHRSETATHIDAANAADLASDHQHTIDPDRRIWSVDRQAAHSMIIDDIYQKAEGVPNNHEAIIAGGLCGAGKTTVLNNYAGIDLSQYLKISPDDIKEALAKLGLVPEIDGLSPMEASDLVHKESSYIARQLAARAQTDGKNLIWDIQLSSRESADERIDNLRSAGYERIDAVFVDIPVEVSLQRADARHREGEEKYRAGIGLGGRYVPPEAITFQADPEWGSKNRKAFEELKLRFDQWRRYDNSVDGGRPQLVETSWRDDNREESTS
jgi:predicted kinase